MSVAALVFARCAGFVSRAPGFSYPGVAPPLRVALALAIAFAVLPGVHAAIPAGAVAFVGAVALEFFIGSALGTGAAVLYDAAYAGGRAIDDYVGVKAIAPSVHLVAPSGFGRVWSLAFTGAFFLLGAYRPIVLAFAESFDASAARRAAVAARLGFVRAGARGDALARRRCGGGAGRCGDVSRAARRRRALAHDSAFRKLDARVPARLRCGARRERSRAACDRA